MHGIPAETAITLHQKDSLVRNHSSIDTMLGVRSDMHHPQRQLALKVWWGPEEWAAVQRVRQRLHSAASIAASAAQAASPLLTSSNLQASIHTSSTAQLLLLLLCMHANCFAEQAKMRQGSVFVKTKPSAGLFSSTFAKQSWHYCYCSGFCFCQDFGLRLQWHPTV